jgi:hypothetical protein
MAASQPSLVCFYCDAIMIIDDFNNTNSVFKIKITGFQHEMLYGERL